MTKNPSLEFSRRYHGALRVYLRRRVRGRSHSQSAGALGRAALGLGLTTLDVVRTHQDASNALNLASTRSTGSRAPPTAAGAGRFLLGVIAPMTPSPQAVRRAAARLRQLELRSEHRSAAQTAAHRLLQRELTRRKRCERRLLHATKHHHFLLSQSRRTQKQSRRFTQQILAAQEAERKAISRELQDEVAQILAGINVHLAALREAALINGRTLPERIAQTQRIVEHSIEAVHRYARELRPALLDDLGLIPALRSFIRSLSTHKELRIRFSAFAGVDALDSSRRTVLYRVAQEALTNIARHAHARNATVRIRCIENTVRLEIHDDGDSFQVERVLGSKAHRRHLGLRGMRERVEMVGGRFTIRSTLRRGTTVRAEISLPLRASAPPRSPAPDAIFRAGPKGPRVLKAASQLAAKNPIARAEGTESAFGRNKPRRG